MKRDKNRPFVRTPGTRNFAFAANKALSDKIIALSKELFRSMASTIRMLIHLGIEEYDLKPYFV